MRTRCRAAAPRLIRGSHTGGASLPAGALFACTLWFGNAAYTYLSVSFIQMLKALMPAAVYTCSVAWARTRRRRVGVTLSQKRRAGH